MIHSVGQGPLLVEHCTIYTQQETDSETEITSWYAEHVQYQYIELHISRVSYSYKPTPDDLGHA